MSNDTLENQAMKLLEEADALIEEGTPLAERLCALIAPCSEEPEAFHWDLLGLDTASDLRRGLAWALEQKAEATRGSLGVLIAEFPDGIARARRRLEKLRRIVTAIEAVE